MRQRSGVIPAPARPASPPAIRARLRSWAADEAVRQSVGVFLLTRLLFLLLTYFGVILFEDSLHKYPRYDEHPSFLHSLLPAWNQWDTKWYVEIAQRGYHWINPAGTSPTAFFPLYPLLIHIGMVLTHRSGLLVALLISNICFLAALIYLWRLANWEFGSTVASRTLLYIAVFPTALFFFAGYTESLFLLLSVACFYHLRRRDWLLAGVFGGLAAATRVAGVLLVLPLGYEYFRSLNFSMRLTPRAISLLLVPAGLLAFMLYLWLTVGDALAFAHHQAAWQKIFTPLLWSGFLESLRQIVLVRPAASFFEVHNVINVSLGGLFLVCTIMAARRLPAAYTIYGVAFWLETLSSPAMANGYPVPLISLSRYILALFPVFLYFGIVGARPAWHNSYLVLSTGMLALFTVQFVTGGWII